MSATESSLGRRVIHCARALPVVVAVRLALWCLPLERLRAFASRTRRRQEADPHPIVRGVATAARFVPGASCLVRALAAQILLARAGVPATLRLGIRKDPDGKFQAHAWLEWRGEPLLGDGWESYVPLKEPVDNLPSSE